jgi:hypothetical protein
VLRLQSASAERHIFGGEMIVAGAPRARVRKEAPTRMAEWVHPAPSGKEHAFLALHRYKKYMRSPESAHEPGGLFSCSERAGAPTRVCVRRPRPGKHLLEKPQYQIEQHYDDDHSYNDADGVPRHPHLLPSPLASLRPMPRIAQGPEPLPKYEHRPVGH